MNADSANVQPKPTLKPATACKLTFYGAKKQGKEKKPDANLVSHVSPG